MTIKVLFRLFGTIRWITKDDRRFHLSIPKEKAIFRWATSRDEAEKFFRKEIYQRLRKEKHRQNRPASNTGADIWLFEATTEELRRKQTAAQEQLKLFKRNPR